MGEDFYKTYSKINGFLSHDTNSKMMIWSLADVEKNINLDEITDEYFIIGDFFIDSDYIVAKIGDKNAKVKLFYENRYLSDSIESLIEGIAAGRFDFS